MYDSKKRTIHVAFTLSMRFQLLPHIPFFCRHLGFLRGGGEAKNWFVPINVNDRVSNANFKPMGTTNYRKAITYPHRPLLPCYLAEKQQRNYPCT